MSEQLTLFDTLWERYKVKKPIRLIELFAGYGSQHLALKYLGADFESWKISEWAIKSIQAYKDLHCGDDNTDYSKDLSVDEITDFLFEKGISSNYNEPMTREQIVRLGAERERVIYNNIKATHNLVSVCNIKGKDLNIENKDKYEYLLTYSFPCQDLSLAGNTKGMKKGSGTRSGLLWEVERILLELQEENALPQILLMENVTQVHGSNAWEDFEAWKKALQNMGYCNFWKDLIATDYGVPQTRERTFMISILGDYNYEFPQPKKLTTFLKDLLEENVPEKCFLSEKMMNYIISKDDKYKVSESNLIINRNIACTKTTREGSTRADTSDYICNSLPANTNILKIKNATKQGYLIAEEGDGIDIGGRMETHRGTVQKNKAQTILTGGAATEFALKNQ